MKPLSCTHVAAVTKDFGVPHRGFDYLGGKHALGTPASLSTSGPTTHNPKANHVLEALCAGAYIGSHEVSQSKSRNGFAAPDSDSVLLPTKLKANDLHADWLRENHALVTEKLSSPTEQTLVRELLEGRARAHALDATQEIGWANLKIIPAALVDAVRSVSRPNLSFPVTFAYATTSLAAWAFSGKDPVSVLGSGRSLNEIKSEIQTLKTREDGLAGRIEDVGALKTEVTTPRNARASGKAPRPSVDLLLAQELDNVRAERNTLEGEYLNNLGYHLHSAKNELDHEEKFAAHITPERRAYLESRITNLSNELAQALLRK